MKQNKLIIALFVFVLLVSSVYAECPPDCGSSGNDYDYSSDEGYSDPDFYTDSDPSQWDYSRVDWEKVDFNRVELYSSSEFYNNIPDDRYGDLDYQQVDYAQIQDHNKIDSTKYFQDMGCSSCSLNRGNQNLIFSKNGITHPNGNSVSVPGTYPTGSLFVATKDRIEVIVPEDTATIDIPTGDSVTLNTQGREITLSDGTKVNGKLSYDNNQALVKEGDKAIINNVEVFAAYNNVNIFNDGDVHEGNYVSFGDKNVIIQGDNFDVRFQVGNQYVNVNSDESDRFIVSPENNGKASITNHDDEGKAPEVIVTGSDYVREWARIINGKFDAILGNEGVMKLNANEALQSEFGSVPMEIKILDNKGNSLILGENGEEGKIVINNDNDLSYSSINSDVDTNGVASCSGGGMPTGNVITGHGVVSRTKARVACWVGMTTYYNNKRDYLKNYLHKNFGEGTEFNIEFVNIKDWTYGNLEVVRTNLDKLNTFNPNLVSAINSIEFEDVSFYDATIGEKKFKAKATHEGKIILNDFFYQIKFTTFAHEAAHVYHNKLIREGKAEEFNRRWYEIQGDGDEAAGRAEYGKYVNRDIIGYKWKDRSSWNIPARAYDDLFNSARYGFVSSYGNARHEGWDYSGSNPFINLNSEDVATYIESIAQDGTVPNIESPKYYKKVQLLCQYGFLHKSHTVCKS